MTQRFPARWLIERLRLRCTLSALSVVARVKQSETRGREAAMGGFAGTMDRINRWMGGAAALAGSVLEDSPDYGLWPSSGLQESLTSVIRGAEYTARNQ